MTYTKTSDQSWISQSPSDDRLFIMLVDEDPSLRGDHVLSVQVSSNDYPNFIAPKSLEVPVTVTCSDPMLIDESYVTQTWEPSKIGETNSWGLPTYSICF